MDTAARGLSERSLLDRARRGEVEAFSTLVRLHQRDVCVFVGTNVRDRHALDDLVQDIFIRAFHSLPTLREPGAFRSWLFGTAHHREFHHTADTIAAAARKHDRVAVTRALGSTLQSCTGCHAVFKQSVVDEATWNRLTWMAAPSGPPGH